MIQHDIIDTGQSRIQSFAFCLAASVSVCLTACFVVTSLAGSVQSCVVRLDSRINPNDAPMASLVRLPGIGIGKAAAIVAYRENSTEQNGDRPAFQNANDLQKVKGIGPKTVQNISQWLKFE